MTIEEQALKILEDFPIHKEMPASISGKYHLGETSRRHLVYAVNIMEHLCKEFKIESEDRDMLLGATWLHDVGLYVITIKGKVEASGWMYFEKTGYSRNKDLWLLHPIIGAQILEKYEMPQLKEIQKLVSVHMSHWFPQRPQPETFYERLICIADYLASIRNVKGDEDE